MQVCPGLGHHESLRKLIPDAQFFGAGDIGLGGCTSELHELRAGDLFVALDSAHTGSDSIAEAIARGSAGVLCDRPLPEANIPVCLVSNAREAYGLICQALAGHPSDVLKIIGVTGANGKTTTSCLIAGVLAHAGNKVGLLSRLGYFDGEDVEYAAVPTPPPDRLASVLARMVRNGCSHAVAAGGKATLSVTFPVRTAPSRARSSDARSTTLCAVSLRGGSATSAIPAAKLGTGRQVVVVRYTSTVYYRSHDQDAVIEVS